MWDRFTQRAKRVVAGAQEEAAHAGSESVRTEHILLSMCKVTDCIATRALENLGVDPERVAHDLEQTIERETATLSEEFVSFTPRAKMVLELAVDEARRLNHNYIGTEHIALGLIKEGQGVASKMLQDMKVDWGRMMTEALRLLNAQGSGGPTPVGDQKMDPRKLLRAQGVDGAAPVGERKTEPPKLNRHQAEIAAIAELKEAAIRRQDYERATILRDCERRLAAMLDTSN